MGGEGWRDRLGCGIMFKNGIKEAEYGFSADPGDIFLTVGRDGVTDK